MGRGHGEEKLYQIYARKEEQCIYIAEGQLERSLNVCRHPTS